MYVSAKTEKSKLKSIEEDELVAELLDQFELPKEVEPMLEEEE